MNLVKVLGVTLSTSLALTFSGAALAKADIAAGKKKAENVCSACHGADGQAAIPSYPNLAGQNRQYLVEALKAYRSNHRSGGQAAIMQSQAAALSDQDIENVAAYYAGLKACKN